MRTMRGLLASGGAMALAVLALCGCGPSGEQSSTSTSTGADGKPLEKVQLALNWYPESEHGGFYEAQLAGFYAAEGLEVEILPGGVDVAITPRVALGQVEFGISNADQILIARNQGANVVAVMTPIQDSPRCIVVRADSNIHTFDDLRGITLAMSLTDPYSEWVKLHAPLTDVTIVPYPGNVLPLVTGKNYAMQGYVFSEPLVARAKGVEVRTLNVKDLGWNPYTSTLMTSDKYLAANPDTVRRMVRASIRGWVQYLDKPEATNAHINKLNPEQTLDILRDSIPIIRDMTFKPEVEENGLGTMSRERWQTMYDQLVQVKVITPGRFDPTSAYTLEFLPKKGELAPTGS